MTTISRSALVPFTPAEMYALVDDIEAYPRFLPWCRSAEVIARSADEVRAMLELSKGGVHRSFTTHNRMQPDKLIEIRLVDGPFRHLNGFWRFEALGDEGCRVSLDMDFEFANALLDMMIAPVFNPIVNSLVDAFHERARAVYVRR